MAEAGATRHGWLRAAGWTAILGSVAVVVANIVGAMVVEDHDWISETISALAAGPHAWIQDLGLVLFALAFAALGVGLWRLDLDGLRWKAGAAALLLIAVDVAVIGLRNEYGDGDSDGVVIHSKLVWLLGGLLVLALGLLARGLGRVGEGWRSYTIGVAVAWALLSPPFFLFPTGWDGLYERGLALLVIAWVVPVAVLLLQEGRAR